uniref:RNA 3'-terminal phosphate cyclase n=1 Tax=Schistosoma mansoni TaxID=6183 RepID=A0A3Q0KMB7_SCHMA
MAELDSFHVTLVDGSVMESGGQILRNAVSIAAITKKPIEVYNIRAGRQNPGLRSQHAAALELVSRVCCGRLSSCAIGSTKIRLIPGQISPGSYEADAKTAGSVSLMLQAVAPVLAFASSPSELLLRGGTDTSFAPPISYMVEVTSHYFRKMGLVCEVKIVRRGFYPLGGGIVKVLLSPLKEPLSPISLLNAGTVETVTGYFLVAGKVPLKIAHEVKDEALRCLSKCFSCPINIDSFQESGDRCQGDVAAFMFVIHTSTDCRLAVSGIINPRGHRYRHMVSEACQSLYNYSKTGICCDDYMQDQLIMPMALAKGNSQIRCGPLTLHTKTAIYVAEHLLGVKFEVTTLNDESSIISCNGVGYTPEHLKNSCS